MGGGTRTPWKWTIYIYRVFKCFDRRRNIWIFGNLLINKNIHTPIIILLHENYNDNNVFMKVRMQRETTGEEWVDTSTGRQDEWTESIWKS